MSLLNDLGAYAGVGKELQQDGIRDAAIHDMGLHYPVIKAFMQHSSLGIMPPVTTPFLMSPGICGIFKAGDKVAILVQYALFVG